MMRGKEGMASILRFIKARKGCLITAALVLFLAIFLANSRIETVQMHDQRIAREQAEKQARYLAQATEKPGQDSRDPNAGKEVSDTSVTVSTTEPPIVSPNGVEPQVPSGENLPTQMPGEGLMEGSGSVSPDDPWEGMLSGAISGESGSSAGTGGSGGTISGGSGSSTGTGGSSGTISGGSGSSTGTGESGGTVSGGSGSNTGTGGSGGTISGGSGSGTGTGGSGGTISGGSDSNTGTGGSGGTVSGGSGSNTGTGGSGGTVSGGSGSGTGTDGSGGGTAQEPEKAYFQVTVQVTCHKILHHPDLHTQAQIPDSGVMLDEGIVVQRGDTVYDALLAACDRSGLSLRNAGTAKNAYITAIGGLKEKECGQYSGWKYKVNGQVPSKACSSYPLKEGDVVEWYYVTTYLE